MKKLSFLSLTTGALMLMALGATSVSANDMKCGAGKCGSMEKPAKKCGANNASHGSKCGDSKKEKAKKCGAEKKEKKEKAMKCGAGKCGSSD